MKHLLLLLIAFTLTSRSEAHWEWLKNATNFCLVQTGLMQREVAYEPKSLRLFFDKMVHESNIGKLRNYPIGQKGVELINAMENEKLFGGYTPFINRNQFSNVPSEEFCLPRIAGILSRGVKEFKTIESEAKDRVKIEITFLDGKKAYIFAGKQVFPGSTENYLSGIDVRPTYHHFFIQNESGTGYYVASQRFDQNHREQSNALKRNAENQKDDSLLKQFEEKWENSEPLPDPFVPPAKPKPQKKTSN